MNDLPTDFEKKQDSATLNLLVRQIRFEANGINTYELVDPNGAALPPVTAGAHIDVYLDNGMVRQYSLCNDPAETNRYVIAVLKDEAGRGGSKALQASIRVQDIVKVGPPRNNFVLDENASHYLLLAGGIGITPLKSMCHRLESLGKSYKLYYCAKTPDFAAFKDDLAKLGGAREVVFHYDNGDVRNGLDLKTLLATHNQDAQLYYCGPPGFMQACFQAAQHWPKGAVHYEHFGLPVAPASTPIATDYDPDAPFPVKLNRSGRLIQVNAGQSLVDALGKAGVHVDTSCESGLCGSCKLPYLSGEPEHLDYILSEDEKRQYLTACVSRCRVGPLVLDI